MNFINIAHAGVISDAPTFQQIEINILYFLLSVAGIIAIMALVVSGVMYFFSTGDEMKMETAKKSAKYVLVGIVIAMGGMIIVKLIGQFF